MKVSQESHMKTKSTEHKGMKLQENIFSPNKQG